MKFAFPAGAAIDIPDPVSADAAVAAVCSHSGLNAEIDALAKSAGFCRFERSQDMDQSFADKIAAKFFDEGKEAAEDFIHEAFDEYNEGPENYLHEVMIGTSSEMGAFLDAFVEPIGDLFPHERDGVAALVIETLKDRLCEKISEFDDSSAFDVIPPNMRVEAFRVLGDASKSLEDELVINDFVSNVLSLQSVMPNDNLKYLFEAANIGMDEFAAHVHAKDGIDLRAGPKNKDLQAWLVRGDYIKKSDDPQALSNAAARAVAWKSFAPRKDPDRPAAMPCDRFALLLSEATYGGIPCYVCRMPLKVLLDFDWSQPILMTPPRGLGDRSGGFLAVFNPWNGSGDVESLDHPLPLPAGREGWKVSGQYGYSVDSVFGIVPACYYADPVVDERRLERAPSPAM